MCYLTAWLMVLLLGNRDVDIGIHSLEFRLPIYIYIYIYIYILLGSSTNNCHPDTKG